MGSQTIIIAEAGVNHNGDIGTRVPSAIGASQRFGCIFNQSQLEIVSHCKQAIDITRMTKGMPRTFSKPNMACIH